MALLFIGLGFAGVHAEMPSELSYEASLVANASSGALAPYMIGSWNYGKITGASGIWQLGKIEKKIDRSSRFSWGAGFEYVVGYGSAADYSRYDNGNWTLNADRQASLRLQQLFAEVKYRGVFLTLGMKEHHSSIVDDALSSGDITLSNNSRPIPGASAGFIDFQDIPFTNGWVQIDGEIMYCRMTDASFKRNTFNYYYGLLSQNLWYTYKRCYFRTKPSMPFSVTVGMQAAGTFAGSSSRYTFGSLTSEENRGFHIRDIWDMFFPSEGGEDYYKGSSLGSWDFKARYRFNDGSRLSAYFEWPWEDGSGIGRRNGWDGVWGLQYDFASCPWVDKVLIEYLDFTNQSGPMHFAPGDYPGTDISTEATGGDDYYNNFYYGPYSYYGMSIGTPFLMSPIYNTDGYPEYARTRSRGFHAAVSGSPAAAWGYVAKLSWQRAGGNGRLPAARRLCNTSAMAGVRWTPDGKLKGWKAEFKIAFDAGELRGNNVGAMLSVAYNGKILFKK